MFSCKCFLCRSILGGEMGFLFYACGGLGSPILGVGLLGLGDRVLGIGDPL